MLKEQSDDLATTVALLQTQLQELRVINLELRAGAAETRLRLAEFRLDVDRRLAEFSTVLIGLAAGKQDDGAA